MWQRVWKSLFGMGFFSMPFSIFTVSHLYGKVIHDFKCVVLIRYYKNITSNTLILLEAMKKHGVKKLIYSSTCATYGEPEKMPITEETPQVI
jgi:UDP-glucose 4-epimerase